MPTYFRSGLFPCCQAQLRYAEFSWLVICSFVAIWFCMLFAFLPNVFVTELRDDL